MVIDKLRLGAIGLAVATAIGASFLGGAAYGQRSAATSADRPLATGIFKMPDGRQVRPLSATVQAKIDAAVNGAMQLNRGAGTKVDLEAGRTACVAKCQELLNHEGVTAEECEPNPLNQQTSGGIYGNAPLPDNPCKKKSNFAMSPAMLVSMCETHCAEKFRVK